MTSKSSSEMSSIHIYSIVKVYTFLAGSWGYIIIFFGHWHSLASITSPYLVGQRANMQFFTDQLAISNFTSCEIRGFSPALGYLSDAISNEEDLAGGD